MLVRVLLVILRCSSLDAGHSRVSQRPSPSACISSTHTSLGHHSLFLVDLHLEEWQQTPSPRHQKAGLAADAGLPAGDHTSDLESALEGNSVDNTMECTSLAINVARI